MRIILTFAFFTLMLSSCNEISQWRGPERDGSYPEKDLLKEWPKDGPSLKIKIEGVGMGLSQPIVYKNVIYLTGIKQDTLDVISAYNMKGKLLWKQTYSFAWSRTYPESRGTPTIRNNKIYLIGGMGDLVCLNAKNGKEIWRQRPHVDFEGKYKHWGVVESVLLTDNAALYITGGEKTTLVAYDKETGKLLWKTKSMKGPKSYASSSLIKWKGQQIALVQTSNDLIGVDVSNGDVLWSYNTIQFHTKKGKGEAANTPLFLNGDIFVTYGNDHPGILFSIAEDGKSIDIKWKNEILDTHHGGLILYDGAIYASNMLDNTRGQWACVDWETGETLWEEKWFTKGSIIEADGMLYLYEEKGGNVALVKPDKNEMKIVSSFKVRGGKGPHWAHPAIYNGLLYIRHGNVLMVYDIKA